MRMDRSLSSLRALLSLGLVATIAGSAPAFAANPIPESAPPDVSVAEIGTTATVPSTSVTRGRRVSDAVVLISIDGLRPDAIARFGAETLQRLMREGSYSLEARTILPSKTLPSHTSMLTGMEPTDHGITWNEDQAEIRGPVGVPTVFGLSNAAGMETAAFFSKPKFHHLEVPGTLDYSASPRDGDRWTAEATVQRVEEYLDRGKRPDLMFVHIPDVDYTGHRWSWMSWMYGRAVRRADDAVTSVLAAADRAYGEDNYTLIVTADHGGSGWTHGSDDPRDQTIPWIVWGQGVRAGTSLGAAPRTVDTAATALWLLGVSVPDSVVGRPVESAFRAEAWLATSGSLRYGSRAPF